MKQYILKSILSIALLALTIDVSGQALRSAYFLDGYTYRHQLNPAFMGERNYVSIPILGNINIGLQGNVGLSDFIYKYNDPKYDLTTFMNSSVDNREFLDNLKDRNKINTNINMTILSFGFHKWHGFNTFEIGLRSQSSLNLPYELFHFMKTGMDNEAGTRYNIKDLTLRTNNYVEIAFGHSRELLENQLTVGAKLKVLLGGGNANAYIKNMDIYMSDEQWQIEADGKIEGSVKGGYFKTKEDEVTVKDAQGNKSQQTINKINGFDIDGPGLGGWGLGLDLGAVYNMNEFVEGLSLSASVLDLGFIKWNNSLNGKMVKTYTFDGFENIEINNDKENKGKPIEDQFDDLGDELEDFIKFTDEGNKNSRTTMLAATVNIGAEYTLPYYKRLKFGFLSSTYINKPFTWSEGRISANVSPLNWFDASINYGISTFGSSLGWILNFHPKGFNFFIGSDHMITKVNPQFIPINNLNANVNIGFNITFGKKH